MDDGKNDASLEEFIAGVNAFSRGESDPLTDPEAIEKNRALDGVERAAERGKRLKGAREKQGLTLEELAARTDISLTQLVELEQGKGVLPLGRLIALSKALSLRIADVFSSGTEPFTIVRADDRQKFARFGEAKQTSFGYEYEALALGKQNRRMEPFIVTLKPASGQGHSCHDGQEFIFVLSGEVELSVEGSASVLRAGDAAYYDSTSRHLVRAHGQGPAKLLAVLSG